MGLPILLVLEIYHPSELRMIMSKEKVQVWGARQKPSIYESGAYLIGASGPIVNGTQDKMAHQCQCTT